MLFNVIYIFTEYPNLVDFIERVQRTYFHEWIAPVTSAPPSPSKSYKIKK